MKSKSQKSLLSLILILLIYLIQCDVMDAFSAHLKSQRQSVVSNPPNANLPVEPRLDNSNDLPMAIVESDSRREVLLKVVAFSSSVFISSLKSSNAFEGGIGGLGKTKPATGVVLWSEESVPIQNQAGIVTAEINVDGKPILTSFQTPWSLLPTTAGLEARDLQNSESAFVQVIENSQVSPTTKAGMVQLLQESVLSQQGKFGAYAAPTDVKVKKLEQNGNVITCGVTFTTFTPGLRESERQLLIKAYNVNKDNWVLLVVGTTRQRFTQQLPTLQNVLDSFEVIRAPSTSRR